VSRLKQFGQFWYDFIIGDDWRIALGVVAAVAVTVLAAHNDLHLWWLLPLSVAVLLGVSVTSASRPRR